MSHLQEALDAIYPDRHIDAEPVERWLYETYEESLQESFFARLTRERRERAEERKRGEEARLARAIPYRGQIAECQAGLVPSRGAPYRCRTKARFAVRNHDGRIYAACARCVRSGNGLYTGWGGDPNPLIEPIEPEYQP